MTPPPVRRAPVGMRLPIPKHVVLTSVALGLASGILGFAYVTQPVQRSPELQRMSVVAAIEHPLGWVMLVVGVWVAVAAVTGQTRASAHALASIAHAVYLLALVLTYALAYPLQPLQGVALGLFGFVAHGGACLAYWQRGYR